MLAIVCRSSPLEAVGNGELTGVDATGASVLSPFSSSKRVGGKKSVQNLIMFAEKSLTVKKVLQLVWNLNCLK